MFPFYTINFTIPIKTSYGEQILITGDIPELGKWKNFQKMTWTENHIWKYSLQTLSDNFEYKYIISRNDKLEWEEGKNRICEVKAFENNSFIINDFWKAYRVKFLIYFPLANPEENVGIKGDIEELGFWKKAVKMKLGNEILDNNNLQRRFWELELILPKSVNRFAYKYCLMKSNKEEDEREVGRLFYFFESSKEEYNKILEKYKEYPYNKPERIINGIAIREDINMALEGLLYNYIHDYIKGLLMQY